VQRLKVEIKVSDYLIVSRGARIAFDIAPASAPLANSLASLLSKIVCGELDKREGLKQSVKNSSLASKFKFIWHL
jgi:hypothetical protein